MASEYFSKAPLAARPLNSTSQLSRSRNSKPISGLAVLAGEGENHHVTPD